jgi:ABC transport system ATP-binding/permease protein
MGRDISPNAPLLLVRAPGTERRLQAGRDQVSWLFPSRWGFAAAASTTNFSVISPASPGTRPDPLWNHSGHTWLMDMGLQLALAAVLAFLTWRRLKGQAPGRRR